MHTFLGKEARQGDLIACVVEFGKIEHGHVPVVFTLNGEVICEVNMKYDKGKSELYPFIGMGHQGIRVLAKVRRAGRVRNIVYLTLQRDILTSSIPASYVY